MIRAVATALLCATLLPPSIAQADPPAPFPQPVLAPLAPGQVVRIGPVAGTGTPTRDYGIGATDLCEFMEFPSGLLQVCGDSFAGQGVAFGPHFSPVALHVAPALTRQDSWMEMPTCPAPCAAFRMPITAAS